MSIESQASAAEISKYYRKNWKWSFNIVRHGGSYPGVREFPTFIIILMTGSKFFQALWKSPCWGKADVSPSLRSGSEGSSLHKVSLKPCIKPGIYYELQHDSQSLYTPWKDVSITTALMMSRQSVQNVLLENSIKVRQTQPIPCQENKRRLLSKPMVADCAPSAPLLWVGWALLCSSLSVVVFINNWKQWLSM